jgi:DNA-directed RNA polymerase specialized sigma54-like protein
MKDASDVILKLEPVTFRYKHELSPEGTPEFGLIAEQVEKVNPDLIVRDKEGKPFSVRYDAVNAMLLNEFLKEHLKNERQESRIAEQQKQIERLNAALEKQAEQLQKVADTIAKSKPCPRLVDNDNL